MDWTGPREKLVIGAETELIRVLIEPWNPNVDGIDGLEITGIGLERLGILYRLAGLEEQPASTALHRHVALKQAGETVYLVGCVLREALKLASSAGTRS